MGGLRISAIWRFPETLRELGVDVEAMLAEAGIAPESSRIETTRSAMRRWQAFRVCGQRLNRDEPGPPDRPRLADLGLAGELARCGDTVEEGLAGSSSTTTCMTRGHHVPHGLGWICALRLGDRRAWHQQHLTHPAGCHDHRVQLHAGPVRDNLAACGCHGCQPQPRESQSCHRSSGRQSASTATNPP